VLCGAAEFSRAADFAILASPVNLERLRAAMDSLQAQLIAVPPFEPGAICKARMRRRPDMVSLQNRSEGHHPGNPFTGQHIEGATVGNHAGGAERQAQ